MYESQRRGKYLALFNLDMKKDEVTVTFSEIGLAGTCRVRDLWVREDLGEYSGSIKKELDGHGAGLYRLECAN